MANAATLADACPVRPSGRQLLDEHFTLIQAVVRSVACAGRLRPDERDDFESYAWIKLLDNDQRRLGRYRGECPFPAFLKVILRRVLLDYRISRWGRWRPSAEARRAGAGAIDIERRVVRDGYPIHAVARIGSCDERRLLSRLKASPRAPARLRVREEPIDVAVDIAAAPEPSPEAVLISRAQEARHSSVGAALTAAIGTLSADERRLLALRYEEGRAVSCIAASAGRDQKRLYRSYERILRKLRVEIEGRGIDHRDVRETVLAGVLPATTSAPQYLASRHVP